MIGLDTNVVRYVAQDKHGFPSCGKVVIIRNTNNFFSCPVI